MKRILLTGMSGTGKSTLTRALEARGFKAVDLDTDAYSHWVEIAGDAGVEPGRDWVWREERVAALLDLEDAPALFVSGTSANMGRFWSRFDAVVLLSAKPEIIADRLRSRTTNNYGKRPEELARVLALIEEIEPLLRRGATLEIDTDAPLEDVLARLEMLARD